MTLTRKHLALALLVVIAVSRGAYVIHDRTFTSTRGAELERAAASLAREGTLGNIYGAASGPSAHVAPLYPVLLAGVYAVFGWTTQAGRVVQEILATTATAIGLLMLPIVARRVRLDERAGWIAAIVLAVLPLNLWIETSGSWEQPYAALALIGLVLLFTRIRREQWAALSTVSLTGVVAGLTILLSPVLGLAVALMTLGACEWRTAGAATVRRACLLAVIAAGVILPWTIRNYIQLGAVIPVRSNAGLELALGNNDWANGRTFVTAFDAADNVMLAHHPLTSEEERLQLLRMGEARYMSSKRDEAWQWIARHPEKAAALTVARFRLYWFPPPDLWSPSSPGRWLKSGFGTVTGLASLCALIVLAVSRHTSAGILAGAVLGPSLPYLVTHVDPRYRYPVYGLTTLLAVDLLLRLLGRRVPVEDRVRASPTASAHRG